MEEQRRIQGIAWSDVERLVESNNNLLLSTMNLVEDHESKINGQKEILNKIIKGNTEIKDKIEGLQRDQFELRREDKRLEDLQRELRRENESL